MPYVPLGIKETKKKKISANEDIPLCAELNVWEVIKSLSLKKALAFDLLTAELLVQLPHNIFEALTKIKNAFDLNILHLSGRLLK